MLRRRENFFRKKTGRIREIAVLVLEDSDCGLDIVKKLIVAGGLLILLLIILTVTAIVYAFSTVKPTTEAINQDLGEYFSKVIYVPQGIPLPIQGWRETIYFWEMETLENEVTGIRLKHDTAFSKNQKTISLTLEKEEKGDASIFSKVLAAVIADEQSLDSARDPQKANLSANRVVGYNNIRLSVIPATGQTTQIVWEFDKSSLPQNLQAKYKKLEIIPEPLLKFLYALPHFIISLFST